MIEIDKLVGTGALTEGQTYKAILLKAHFQIGQPGRWTQRAFAKNGYGAFVRPTDPAACCWCLMGGVAKCSNSYGLIPPPLLRYMEEMMQHIYGRKPNGEWRFLTMGEMNDYLDHASVLEFLSRCIENIPD